MTAQLTVLIPCKNEADNIEACIRSVHDLGDEILVADSGSTDETRELAAGFDRVRIIEREFINAGNFKNWAIPQAKHRWVFVLDADERVTPELAESIREVLRDPTPRDGYVVYRRNHFLGHPVRHTAWGRDKVTRLFQRDRGRYQIYTDHAEVELPRHECGVLRGKLEHFTCWDYASYLQKMQNYTEQQAELWYRQGKRTNLLRMVVTGPFRFFRSYILELGFLDGSVGFQISALTGFYSFLKQAKLWQRCFGRTLVSIEPDQSSRKVADQAA